MNLNRSGIFHDAFHIHSVVCATQLLLHYILQFKHRFSANAIIRDAGVLFQLKVFENLIEWESERKKPTQKSTVFQFILDGISNAFAYWAKQTTNNNTNYRNSNIIQRDREREKKIQPTLISFMRIIFMCVINSFTEKKNSSNSYTKYYMFIV